jgi:hypothetical protein
MVFILTVPGNMDDEEYFWQVIEPYIVGRPDVFTDEFIIDELQFWLDDLKFSIDQEVIRQTPYGVDPGESYFVQWVDHTTVLLRSVICLPNQNLNFMSRTLASPLTISTYNHTQMNLI